MATTIYRGTGWSSDCVGETKNGTVYRGTGWSSSEVGEYKDGHDLSWLRPALGRYRRV